MNHLIISTVYAMHDLYHHRVISFAFAILIFTFSLGYFFTSLIVSGHLKVLVDYCAGAYHCFVLAFVFIGVVTLLKRTESSRTHIWFLTNGCSRTTLIIGLWLGCASILLITSLLYYGIFILFCFHQTGQWLFFIWKSYITYFFEGMLVLSFAFFWSQFLSINMCCAAIACSYLICMLNHAWFLHIQAHTTGIAYFVALGLHYFLPNLHMIDIQSETFYELPIDIPIFAGTLIYTGLFCSILLTVAGYIFKHKQLI